MSLLASLLRELSLREWRLHPWRQGVGVLSVALGVALAFSVHLINESALSEFSAAVRSATGQADATLQCPAAGCDDRVWDQLQMQAAVRAASPVLEVDSYARGPQAQRVSLKILGVDALTVARVAPELLPRPAERDRRGGTDQQLDARRDGGNRLSALDPQTLFLNPAARRLLEAAPDTSAGSEPQGLEQRGLEVQTGLDWQRLSVGGSVAASGTPLAVMDIAGAQERFGALGRISRVDLRLQPGASSRELQAAWSAQAWWPAGSVLQAADDGAQRVSTASRAYRVNLTVLALVALFVGAFLVFSVQALSVSQRTPTLALLGVMGLTPAQRLQLILAESVVLGVLGSSAGLLMGTAAAALALRWLAGDLGGGYFPGIAPTLQFSWGAAFTFGGLGLVAALVGGWAPARMAQALPSAQALKGLGIAARAALPVWAGPAVVVLGAALSFAPPVFGLPLAAYVSVALLLAGGMACVPLLVRALMAMCRPQDHALAVLAVGRARHERQSATVAVAGVVASLSLAVALTVMVASFRTGVSNWLDQVLPADLYARTATSSAASDAAFLPVEFLARAATVEGVERVEGARLRPMVMDPRRPAVSLVARPLWSVRGGAAQVLPLVGSALPREVAQRAGLPGAYVTEAMEMLYGARPGQVLELPVPLRAAGASPDGPQTLRVMVLGVWRDYARQFGAVALDLQEYQSLTGDERVNDLALQLAAGTEPLAVQEALRSFAPDPALIEFAVPAQIRAISLRIFDRSFAVTYYLQALAIGIGLFGIAASFSAQVLARRKEFGLLGHLGLTRTQIVGIVAGEGAAWTAAGAMAGLLLGLAVSAVLVHVVNPQSFHWTMELVLPTARLALLCAAVLLAGSLTAALSARAAASQEAVRAVKEDW